MNSTCMYSPRSFERRNAALRQSPADPYVKACQTLFPRFLAISQSLPLCTYFHDKMELSPSTREQLLRKLNAHHAEESQSGEKHDASQDDAQLNGSSANDETASNSELVLRLVLQSGKFENEKDVSAAVDEYIAGKPLAYITGEWSDYSNCTS